MTIMPPRFDESRPFYPMVATFMAAAAALPLLIDPKERAVLTVEDGIAFASQVSPQLVIRRVDIANEIASGRLSGNQIFSSLCCMLVNAAYEAVKDHRDQSPVWEFFRHVRNAASHRNQFHFFPAEPKRPAAWRTLSIDTALKGQAHPLHGQVCFNAFLWEGDLIELLADVEHTLA